MEESLQSFFIGTLGLLVVLVVSAIIVCFRTTPTKESIESFKAILITAICFHLVHLTEETAYGFHRLFPELVGLAPWPVSVFLGFNFAWIILWVINVFLVAPNRATITTFWFLAIASVINAIAHPVFSILVGGYFPGLVSSPFVGVLGILLVRNLYQASSNAKTLTSAD